MSRNLKRILFFSCEPGGAEALIPVIKLVQAQPRIEVIVTGYGYALERFSKKQTDYVEIRPVQKDDTTFFDRFKPDILITSATSLPTVDMSEKFLWRQAKQNGIPSLAFLDQWQNYSMRFSGPQDHERLAYQPDWINCLNDTGRREMIIEGFDETNLVEFGHPYLSSLSHDLAALDVKKLKADLQLSANDKVALFVSEPIYEYYGDTRGYNQYQVLDYFMSNINAGVEQLKILVKLHPKDNSILFQSLVKKFESSSLQFIQNEFSSLECLAVADYVYGMTSIMLIEAYVLGKTVVSLQPCLSVEDPLVLSRQNLISIVLTSEKHNLLEFDPPSHARFNVEFLTEKFLSFINRTIYVSLS